MSQDEQNKRIDYIEFAAKEIVETKKFYESAFGWSFKDWGSEYTSFDDGRIRGGFRTDVEPSSSGPLIVVYSTDLGAAEAAVKNNGGTIVQETFEFPGGKRFHFADPSGNVLAVWSDR